MRVGFGSVIFVVCLSGAAPPFAPYHDIAVIQSRVWSGSPFRTPNILCARSFFRSKLFAFATPGLASMGTVIFKSLTLCRVYYKICRVGFSRESHWLGLAGLLSPTIMCFSVQSNLNLRCFDVSRLISPGFRA
jgi:hypothetical protein